MGNRLSTWNLTIQSAVDGENFDYNKDYNQVAKDREMKDVVGGLVYRDRFWLVALLTFKPN